VRIRGDSARDQPPSRTWRRTQKPAQHCRCRSLANFLRAFLNQSRRVYDILIGFIRRRTRWRSSMASSFPSRRKPCSINVGVSTRRAPAAAMPSHTLRQPCESKVNAGPATSKIAARVAGGGGGVPIQALLSLVSLLGFKGTLLAGAVLAIGFFVLPAGLKHELLGVLTGGGQGAASEAGAGSVCDASQANGAASDFSRVVLASTEDVWTQQFERGALPNYGGAPGAYRHPTLVVFANGVSTGGCGDATSAVGPFYCPGDQKLYIDPSFYSVMERRLRAPGDFAQAYVIAHEVGHHVQT
jgi:Putative neutral zinc metallopeptidase